MIALRRLLVPSVLALAPIAALADVTYFDGTFNDSDWTYSAATLNAPLTASAVQVTTGGNPGARRETTVNVGPMAKLRRRS